MPGLIILCICYVFSQFFRSFLAVLTPVLSQELGMTASDFAYASGAWFITFALFQFPVGWLLDGIGPRRTAGYIFTAFTGSGTLLFACATSPLMIIVAMGLIGMGCSVALMAPMYIFAREYSAGKFATLVSVFIAVGMLGNIGSSEPLAAAVEAFGWQACSLAIAIVALLVGASIFVTVKDPQTLNHDGRKGSVLDLFKIRELWMIFPIIFCGYVVAAGLRASWIGPFHSELYGYDTLGIGRATLYMSIAFAIGTLFFGPLDRIFNSRKRVVMAGNVSVLLICLAMTYQIPETPWIGTLAFVALGFLGISYPVQMAHGRAFVPEHLTGRGVTLLNFCAIGGAGIFQWIAGPVVEMGSVPGDPQSGYQMLFGYYSILMAVAIVAYIFAKDAKPNPAQTSIT